MEKQFYKFEDFLKDIVILSKKIEDFKPDALVSLARGGMTMGHFLGEYLDMRKVYSINSIHYDDTKKLDEIKLFNFPDLTNHKKIVLVDDISDSGDTLEAVVKILTEKYPKLEIKIATIFYKKNTKVMPDYYIQENEKWIVFFWDKEGQKAH